MTSDTPGATRPVPGGARRARGSRQQPETLRLTDMGTLVFLIAIGAVSKLEKEVWKAPAPREEAKRAQGC